MIAFIVSAVLISIALFMVFRKYFPPNEAKVIPAIIVGLVLGSSISFGCGALVHKDIESKNFSIYKISEKIVLIKNPKHNVYLFNNSDTRILLKEVEIAKTKIIFSERNARMLEIKKETHDKKLDKWFFIRDHVVGQKIFLLEGDEGKIIEIEN